MLLSCLNLQSKRLSLEDFTEPDVTAFLHPCEKHVLQDIVTIINLLRDIEKFAKVCGSNNICNRMVLIFDTDEPLQKGLYLKAFANGIDTVLKDYFAEITALEKSYIQNPTNFSLLYIYRNLKNYEPLALYLRKLIRVIRTQKLHGCEIMQFLHQNAEHGDQKIRAAIKTLQLAVNVVFFKQLTHWILYAKIIDTYGEFFIQCSEGHSNSAAESETSKCASTESGKHASTITTLSKVASTYADIWRYEICYELLPHYLPTGWAEKVLFIGQTILIFKADANKHKNLTQNWNKTEHTDLEDGSSLSNEKEHIYFGKIQMLQNDEELNVQHYESIVNEIKTYVTTRLSEIAINQADLVQQLKLMKDFFLLGRGELFLEFLRLTYIIGKDKYNENKVHDFVKAFESAAHGVGVSEDLERFSLSIAKPLMQGGSSKELEHNYLQYMQLNYKINWPLHLLFSPKVIENYNVLFRFLLLIKKIQFELHMLWSNNVRRSKRNTTHNIHLTNLLNQLMFFIDNLQYYIQVDVLESQFSILLNTILNKADFEEIQKAHSIFLANILSLCFLLTNEDTMKLNINQFIISQSNNPIYNILIDVFNLCDNLCMILRQELSAAKNKDHIDKLDERFGVLMDQLINYLIAFKTNPTTTPLSQLLLRLDFNHWFSTKKNQTFA
ncbi:PREDICTED: gamma-tubulin complex component 4 homolog isoform X2 [Rhagoletis zephyria]|uniref:gamma-tubulin complex component 4 homolog isoform X2 n=1 Tax=Rhagoletis zephyria TaxID=28612 RepID=UPI00081136FE|nr:PREDICTED: gamma-tubulin complex component 4 homolog isoform X2 [Rhagoletis zephyria]XP_036320871.1 gamma-tubulin complex component 4 homolog isoform X2 [Rhagoletis pomonella]